jgi:hypothetical protein
MFIDTPSKKRLIFSIIIYFPIISLVAGTPFPFPSIFEPSAGQIALLNGINVSIAIVGSIVGAAYYLERRNTKKIEKLENMIGEMTIAHREEMKELRKDIKEMETRIYLGIDGRVKNIEKIIEDKVAGAKTLEDERIRNIQNRLNRMEGGGAEGWHYKMRKKDNTKDADGDEYEGEDLDIDSSR